MADKGIIFSAPMVRALLDGRKTQTRRLCKPANLAALSYVVAMGDGWFGDEEGVVQFNTHFAPGDRLYVRESFRHWTGSASRKTVCYVADGVWIDHGSGWTGRPEVTWCSPAKPSIHMPRWASRLTLLVTDVRVQRVRDIDPFDTGAEGIDFRALGLGTITAAEMPAQFGKLWDSLHDKPGERWADNPWVVALTFHVEQRNIDQGVA